MQNVQFRLKGKDTPGPGQYAQVVNNSWNVNHEALSLSTKIGVSIPRQKRFKEEIITDNEPLAEHVCMRSGCNHSNHGL